ncbi:MAG TPA: PQQ-binding-like beta-propeller repeat protein, partial [Planctomycetota bacterium]|nr:PQQ-binding-like beta-propeller repeat protein [Planctomycetota bacterium]
LLLSAEVAEQEKGPREALTYLHQFLAVNGDNPKAPQAQYSLYTLYHKLSLFGAAKSQALQLKRRYAGAKVTVDGKPQEATALAEALLKLPELQPPPSIAMRKQLTTTAVDKWPLNLPRPGQLFPLIADGEPPAGCEKYIYVHDGRDVYCIEGTTGGRKFAHHAFNMAQRTLQAAFAANALVTISGDNAVSGENAAGDDKPWNYDFVIKGEKRNATLLVGSDTLALVVEQKTMAMAGLEPTSGREMWTRSDIKGAMGQMPPRIIESRVVITTFDDGECTVHVLDCQTGENLCAAYKLEPTGIRITAVGSSTLVVQDAKNNIMGFELFSGKLLWTTAIPGPILTLPNRWPPSYSPLLTCTDKQVIAVRDGAVHVLNLIDGKPMGGDDNKSVDLKGVITAMVVEGDQAFVTFQERANMARPFLAAISLTTGTLQWRTPCSMQPQLSAQQITRDHVVVMANDFNNGNTFMLNLIDRVTGKIVYSNKLHNTFPTCLATANGAILLADQQRVHGYVCVDPEEVKKQIVISEKAWQADPKNMTLLLAYVDNLSLDNQPEKAFDIITQSLDKGLVTEDTWQGFASKLEALRRSVLEKHKYKFLVQKTTKPPTLDGDLKDWSDAVWYDFKDLRYIYHDTFDKTLTKGFWKTPEDLSCRTAMKWDKDRLYVCWEVTDDTHVQTQTGMSIWDGDSVQFAVDPNMDGGTSWRQGDTEDTVAVSSADGSSMAAIDYSPTNKNPDFKGTRDKDKHKTYYEMSIPLADVQIDAKDGGRFGYTFIVNDRDDEKSGLNKGLAPSPGIWNPKTPGMYAVAYFGKEGQTELEAKQKEDIPVAADKGNDDPQQ